MPSVVFMTAHLLANLRRRLKPPETGWLDLILPPACVLCEAPLPDGRGRVCGLCWSRAPRQRHPRCPRCGIALPDTGAPAAADRCTHCADWMPYLRQARAPFRMAGSAAAMVHALKFQGWRSLAPEMAGTMAAIRFSSDVEREIRAVVPVPLSATRRRERGYNQARLLARAVAARRAWPLYGDLLVRVRHTRRQARLSSGARLGNVAGAFQVPDGDGRAGDAHLLLVDDVLTTGATVRACTRALCVAGARSVSVLTFARARPALG